MKNSSYPTPNQWWLWSAKLLSKLSPKKRNFTLTTSVRLVGSALSSSWCRYSTNTYSSYNDIIQSIFPLQTSPESPIIFTLLHNVFSQESVDQLKKKALEELSEDEFKVCRRIQNELKIRPNSNEIGVLVLLIQHELKILLILPFVSTYFAGHSRLHLRILFQRRKLQRLRRR